MTPDAWLTVAILVATFLALARTELPPAAIFMGALTLSVTLGLAPLDASLRGFSNAGVLTVGALFMVAAGMYSTGAIGFLADKVIGRPDSTREAQLRILPPIMFGSAFLNNTPLVAMMIPIVRNLCQTTRLVASKLFIPISYVSILGGTSTLIGTSTNLILAGLVIDRLAGGGSDLPPMREIQMFDPTLVALPAAVLGLAFLIAFSDWLLPGPKEKAGEHLERRVYGAEFVIPAGSYLVGKTLKEAGFVGSDEYRLTALWRADGAQAAIDADERLEEGDALAFSTSIESLPTLWTTPGLAPLNTLRPMETERHTHQLVEIVVPPDAPGVGRLVSELPPPDSPFRASLVAVSRKGHPPEGAIRDHRIEVGDNGVVEVDETFFFENRQETAFSLVKPVQGCRILRTDRAVMAGLITGAMVASAALGWLSMLNAAMLATGAMLLTGCLTIKAAARSIDYGTIVVLAAAIGLEAAVSESGLSRVIAQGLVMLGGTNPYTALAVVFVARVVTANLITNAASAVFMFPIALAIASQLGVNFMPFVIALMTGTIGASITPTSYQTNLMVYGPGGYAFADFFRVGIPLTIIVGAVTVFLGPIVFGL